MVSVGAAPTTWNLPAHEFLARAMATLPEGRLRLISLPAPVAPLERLWQAWSEADAVLWHPPAGNALAGVGRALVLRAEGSDRFQALERAVAEVTAGAVCATFAACSPVTAQLVGGFAFTPGGASAEPWSGLGDAHLLLPRWCYRPCAEGAQLTLALTAGERLQVDEVVEGYRRLCGVLANSRGSGTTLGVLSTRDEPPAEVWAAAVARARTRIRAEELAKVVLARRVVVTAREPLLPEALLTSLAAHEAGLYRFGFRVGGRALVGASPELLVARRGAAVRSEALAGSAVHGPAEVDEGHLLRRLSSDPKQMVEHQLVVEGICDALADVCTELSLPPRPQLRALRSLAHLATPIAGSLREPLSVLALAARLHPTPAVGGVPKEVALALIGASEDAPRGWFAGPFGVVEGNGDGELAVALRCALVVGEQAHVWAGAGIVADSNPEEEVKETAAKAAAALAALGLSP